MTAKSPAYSGNTGPRRRALLLPIGIRLLAIPAGLYCALPAHHSRAYGTAAFPRPRPGVDHRFPHVALRTDPPNFPVAPHCDHFRGQNSVQGRMPLTGQLRFPGSQIIESGQHPLPAAIGTAAATHGTGRHCRLIGVSQPAPPPDLPVGTGRDVIRFEESVPLLIPLGGNIRILTLKIVFSRDDLFSGTYRAPSPSRSSGGHGCLPLVALFADPPDPPAGSRRHRIRGEASVPCGMPLTGQLRIAGRQIIFRCLDFPVCTYRAAAAGYPGLDLRPPFMALPAHPPHLPVTAGKHLIRSQRSIFCGMPLTGQLGTAGGKIAPPRHRDFPRTHRAAGSAAGPGMYRCLPGVSVLTPPPDFALAAAGNLTWAQGKIALDVPLLQ